MRSEIFFDVGPKNAKNWEIQINQAFSADWDDVIPVTPCHWDDIIPMDGGWLPHWDEALDESIGINAVYLTTYLYGRSALPIIK